MENAVLKVLIIEDSPLETELIRERLSGNHEVSFEMEAFNRLETGLERLAKGGIHVVLLDMHLPDGKGLENIIKVRGQAPAVPIVILTGTYDAALGVEAVQQGAQDYLLKGETDGKLLARVLRYAIERKRGEEVLRKAHDELEIRVQERTAELIKSNEALKRSQQLVIQQERLRALGEMASGIAHDFNNTLTTILGYSEMCLYDPSMLEDKAKTIECLRLMNTAAKDAAKVVSRLREFYRPRNEKETFSSLDINRLVAQAISLTQPKWKDQAMMRGVTLSVQMELGKVPLITGNESELRDVLTNLIFNAVDAMPRDGTITIGTRVEADRVVLELKDTGTGMTEQVRKHCLEPFFTTKGDKGTGLGLSMIYGIIQRHEGTVEIETELGKGTRFIIRLPGGGKTRPVATEQSGQIQSRPLNILYVEDEPAVRNVIVHYLIQDKHIVEIAANGREGLQKFYGGRFDLVIADRAMPEMSGDQMAEVIHKNAPNKPIILLSGTGDLINAAGEKLHGIHLVISKPVTMDSLRRAIAEVLSQQG